MPADQPAEDRMRAETVVTAAYRAILLREPDPAGMEGWCAELLGGRVDLLGLLQALLHSDEFAGRSPEFLNRYLGARRIRFTNDVSQYGEVWSLVRDMVNGSARHRVVVDVGARGRERSNSYDLLRHFGWRGVLIEANPALIAGIDAEFTGTNVAIVNSAVSNYTGEATFYIGVNDDVSSLNAGATAAWGGIRQQFSVRVQRLADILRAHAVPPDFDLLSIDAEGEDVAILNDAVVSGLTPRWVVIEASNDFQTKSLSDLPLLPAVTDRYEIAHRTVANLILRDRHA